MATLGAKLVLVRAPIIRPIASDHITANLIAAARTTEKLWMRNPAMANNGLVIFTR